MPLKLRKVRKSPYWQMRGTIAGRRIEKSTGTANRAEAEEIRAKFEAEQWKRHRHGPESVATFAEAVNFYLDDGGEARFLAPLLDYFGTICLREIDQLAIDRAARVLYPRAANSTINRQLITPMRSVLMAAAQRGLCERRIFRTRKVEPIVRRSVSRDWLRRFQRACQHLPHLAALAAFMAFTGTRIGKACALTWLDIDLERAEFIIDRDKNGRPHRGALAVPVILALANIPGPRVGKVFGYASRRSVYGAFKRACERAGIDYVPPHQSGRHTFATWMLEAGHNLATVQQAGNWKNARLLMERYAHLEHTDTNEKVRQLGENWGTLAEINQKNQVRKRS